MRSLFLAFCFLAGCDATSAEQSPAPIQVTATSTARPVEPAKLEVAKTAIRAEAKVIDFVYDPKASVEWTIGVKDDGSPRYGFAEYFCLRLGEWGVRDDRTTVRIVDFRKYMEPGGNGRDADLGTVECKTGTYWTL